MSFNRKTISFKVVDWRKTYARIIVGLLAAILIALIFIWCPRIDNQYEASGFKATITPKITILNRYSSNQDGNTLGSIGPLAAQTQFPEASQTEDDYFKTLYATRFNEGTDNWTGGKLNTIQKWSMPKVGSEQKFNSYLLNQAGNSTLTNFSPTLNYNQTLDYSFYICARDSFTNGYISLTFNITILAQIYLVHFVVKDVANVFPTSLPANQFRLNLTGFVLDQNYYGFMVDNFRSILMGINSTYEDLDISINMIYYTVSSASNPRIYIDNIQCVRYGVGANTGSWYEVGLSRTDFVFTIDFDIYIDDTILDIDTFSLYSILNHTIAESSIIGMLVTTVVLNSTYFTWGDVDVDQFTKHASGTFQTENYPLPRTNTWANQLPYSFGTTITVGGFGSVTDGQAQSYSATKNPSISGFTVDWIKVIGV